MIRPKYITIIMLSAAMLVSCAMIPKGEARSSGVEAMEEMVGVPMAADSAQKFAEQEAPSEEFASGSDFDQGTATAERIVIKNASLSIIVQNPAESMEAITDLAEEMGGFVVNSNLYKTTTSSGIEVPNANITIRVPAEELETVLEEIKRLVEDPEIDILSEDISGQDVTSEVTDLESRLRNLEAAEEQLLDIMENATETEGVIEIFRELTNVREEIEVIQGQIKYYRESASLSAISVSLQAKEALEPITIGGWQPGVEVQNALQALVDGGKYLVNILIWLVLFALPILAIIFLPFYFIVRFIRKRKMKKETEDTGKTK